MKAFAAKFDDTINPIVVKELRQAVNGRFLSALLMLFLLVSVVALVIAAAQRDSGYNSSGGQEVMTALNAILLFACIIILPIFTSLRLAGERMAQNVDLMYITTLPPRAIIWGKFAAAIIVAILVYSACMPFMTLSYLLRGIDLPTIFLTLVFGFGVVLIAMMLSIFTACASTGRGFRVLLGLAMLAALCVGYGMTSAGSAQLIMMGSGEIFSNDDIMMAVGVMALIMLSAVWLLYTWSVALITAPSANLMRPVRWSMTIIWLVNSLATWTFAIYVNEEEIIESWAILSVLYFCIGMFIAVCERETWGPRVRETIPHSGLKRFIAFLTYSGSAGGMLWSWLMILIVIGCLIGGSFVADALFGVDMWGRFNGDPDLPDVLLICAGLGLYFFCYTGTAHVLRKIAFSHVVPPAHTWALAMVIGAMACTLPLLIAILATGGEWYGGNEYWLIANPVCLARGDQELMTSGLMFSGIWAFLIAVVWVPSAIAQNNDFRPIASVTRG